MKDEYKTEKQLLNELQEMRQEITELKASEAKRKYLEEALNFERQQLLSIFDSIDEHVYVSNPNTYKVLYANQALLKKYGSVVGQKCYRAFQGLDSPCPFCTNERIFGENLGKPYIWEFQNRINHRWLHCIAKAIRWPDGEMVRYVIAIDVTERKGVEEELRRSEEMFKTLVTHAPLGMNIIAKDGRYEYVNPKFTEIFGYTLKDVPTGKKWFEKAHPDPKYRQKVIARWKEDLRSGKLGETPPRVFTVTCKDGSKKEILFRPAALIDERQLVMYEDITERKQMERELKKSEERYRSLVEDINDGYFIAQDGKFVYINQAFANITGYSKEVILGGEFPSFFPKAYLTKRSKDDLKRKRNRDHMGQDEFEISRQDGKNLILEIRSRVMDYNGRPAIAGICKDITERKKTEKTLKEKVQELERWYQLTVDREIKMIQLKKRVRELESKWHMYGGKS